MDTAHMINIKGARKGLNYDGPLYEEKIKAAFRAAVRTSHSDKGGQGDIEALKQARNLLLRHAVVEMPVCKIASCNEPPHSMGKCPFHLRFF
jgi:hypothetical protein